jgi:hypothetical protein
MGHLILQGNNTVYPGFALLGESSLALTLEVTGMGSFNDLPFLVLSETTSVSIRANGRNNFFTQLVETTNNLTTVTINSSAGFVFGAATSHSNNGDSVVTDIAATATSPTTIHSSLRLIDASASTGPLEIAAGATNTSGAVNFSNGESLNANVTITYTGLTIKGGSGRDLIDNDAKNGIVTDGNSNGDEVILGGAGAKATLGNGTFDGAVVGFSKLVPTFLLG